MTDKNEQTYEELFDSFLSPKEKQPHKELSSEEDVPNEQEQEAEAPEQEQEQSQEEEQQPKPATAKKNEDDYNDLLENVQDEETKQRLQRLIQSERSNKGRVAAYQKRLDTLQSYYENARAPKPSEQEDSTKTASAAEPVKEEKEELSPELAAIKDKYPALYDAMIKVAETEWQRRGRDLEDKFDQKIRPLTEGQQKEAWAREAQKLEQQAAELFETEKTNVTVRDVITSKDFSDWFRGQPAKIQQLYKNAGSAEEAMLVLTKFEKDYQYMRKLNEQIEATPAVEEKEVSSSKGDELKARREKVKQKSVSPSTKAPAAGGIDTDDYDSLFDHYWGENGKYRTNRRF